MVATLKQIDYKRRQENVSKLNDAINLLEQQIKNCIIKQGFSENTNEVQQLEQQIELYTRILSGLVIVWSENMIKWLFYEHGAFEDAQIQLLLGKNELKQKWICAITAAFHKAFSGIPYDPNNPLPSKSYINGLSTISQKNKIRFNKLYDLIDTKLVPAISIRNKIQHGEWINSYSTNNPTGSTEFDANLTNKVENDNILILRLKRNQIK